jgi:hypothetical protein
LALERELMRPRMRAMLLLLPGEMIAALDNERRRYPKIPARNADCARINRRGAELSPSHASEGRAAPVAASRFRSI